MLKFRTLALGLFTGFISTPGFAATPLLLPSVIQGGRGAEIAIVSPASQAPGKPITIEVSGLQRGFIPITPEVTIGGFPATIRRTSYGEENALISVDVPPELTDTELKRVDIYAKVGSSLLRYNGPFDVVPGSGSKLWLMRVLDDKTAVLALLLAFIGSSFIFMFAVYVYRRRLSSLTYKEPLPPIETPPAVEFSVGMPKPPEDLLRALRSGECVAVVGSGMSAQAGLKTWSEVLRQIVHDAITDDKQAVHLQFLLSSGRLDEVVESLNSLLSPAELNERIALAIKSQKAQDMSAYSALARLPLAGAITLNFDSLVEKAWEGSAPRVYLPHQSETALDTLSREEFFIFRLNGALAGEETFFSYQQVKDAVSRNKAFRDLLSRFYYSRTLLFVGASLEGMQAFLRSIDRTAAPARKHFALVQVRDTSWEHVARPLESQFGLKVLPFTEHDNKQAVKKFLAASAVKRDSAEKKSATPALTRVVLSDIGPFNEAEFEIDKSWTVLLGDNGVGKSTVLKAIAVCMTGKATESFARRLVRSGRPQGQIVLYFGDRMYVATISSRGVIESPSGVPLERESILCVGYSSLRAVSGQRAESAESATQRPAASDLQPLISDQPDSRLEGIKQWITRLDHLKSSDTLNEADRQRYAALYDHVFSMFRSVMQGVDVEPGGVNPSTGEITISTRDGPIPLESLSQGTLSLITWTGSFLQRLYETAPAGVVPIEMPAIVLVDEIDVHMHPAWQQLLVERLSETFKFTQFIVTSHSPLLVGGLDPNQVYRLERDPKGLVEISHPDHPLKGLGVAGLLTSGLFGLRSQLDSGTAKKLDRKRELTARVLKGEIDATLSAELDELEADIRDIDFTVTVRDSLYPQFVQAMTAVRAARQVDGAATVLTSEQRQRKSQVAEQIVRELVEEKERREVAPPRNSTLL